MIAIRGNAVSWQPRNVDGSAHCSAAERCGGNDSGDGEGKGYLVHCVLTPTFLSVFLGTPCKPAAVFHAAFGLCFLSCALHTGKRSWSACIRSQRHLSSAV